jgi:glycosyltransferase involved in cell wall biosynthesis
MNIPRISVVLPTHNRAEYLALAVASALAQTESDIELIVVDDASTDSTPELLADLAVADKRIHVIRNNVSVGGAGARNAGIQASRGEWVAFLDDDDEWLPQKLERQRALLDMTPAAVACSCDYIQISPSGSTKLVQLPKNISFDEILRENRLGGASMCFCSRALIMSIDGFDVQFRSGQDWDLWVRIREQGAVAVCNEPLVRYLSHEGVRISNNMNAQYAGNRRFFFKHRKKMNLEVRRHLLAYCSFIKSRQTSRSFSNRLLHLKMAFISSGWRHKLEYVRSSLPRLLLDAVRGLRNAVTNRNFQNKQ